MVQGTRDNLIVVGILLGVVGAATVLVYTPQRRKLQDLRFRIDQEKLVLVDTAQKTAAVPEMVRRAQTMKKHYGNFDRRLPKRKELGGFLREISGNLSQESLTNQVIEPTSPARSELYNTLPIVLRFQGSYLSLASFLKGLETMERLTQVEKLTIRGKDPAAADNPAQKLEIEVLMNIYFTET